jgi:hypothetical protein
MARSRTSRSTLGFLNEQPFGRSGDPSRFKTLGEFVYEIHRLIWDYNHRRIHSVLKMPPKLFANRYETGLPPRGMFTTITRHGENHKNSP